MKPRIGNFQLRAAQEQVLRAVASERTDFALAGGTALERYYLHHRFSSDLDFFSAQYSAPQIRHLVGMLKKKVHRGIRLESELTVGGKAKVQFYTLPVKGSKRPLKIDFVEDVLFEKPIIRKIRGVRVYSAENIYLQKIAAISGTEPVLDEIGREVMEGRREARDVFDLYYLSMQIQPLHRFLKKVPPAGQKGIVHWYRTFSRQGLRLALLDLEIYDRQFNSKEMIRYLEDEVKRFARSLVQTP